MRRRSRSRSAQTSARCGGTRYGRGPPARPAVTSRSASAVARAVSRVTPHAAAAPRDPLDRVLDLRDRAVEVEQHRLDGPGAAAAAEATAVAAAGPAWFVRHAVHHTQAAPAVPGVPGLG